MSIAIVTGSSGLVGSEAARLFHEQGLEIVGIDNNMRSDFFGEDGSVDWNTRLLSRELEHFTPLDADIRDEATINKIFADRAAEISVVLHCAAQPSHDWAAREPITDFTINANGTLVLLEALRRHCPQASFVFMSTNTVYGDTPNRLPIIDGGTRWELDSEHPFSQHGIDESMSIDDSKHSLFGVSKAAADLLVQEYGRYFGLNTCVFRGGCITGGAHSGAELHGFLAYLVKCQLTGRPYTIFGYEGKQVRDNIHARDLAGAFWSYFQEPRPGALYNIGGSRHSFGSILDSIAMIREKTGRDLDSTLSDEARSGDHIWYVSDVRKFQRDYPEWEYTYDLDAITTEIIGAVSTSS